VIEEHGFRPHQVDIRPRCGFILQATGSILPGGFRELTEEETRQMELPF